MRQGRHRSLLALLAAAALAAPAAARADAFDKTAKLLLKGDKVAKGERAAVMPFQYSDGRASPGPTVVAEALSTALAERDHLVLVERSLLKRALEEIELSHTGLISPESMVKAGKLAGAKYLVVGTLTDQGQDRVDVNVRLVESETGVVVSAVKSRIQKSWKDSSEPIRGRIDRSEALTVKTVTLPKADAEDALLRRMGDRRLAVRYSNSAGEPSLLVTDYSGEGSDDHTVEVPIPYDPVRNQFGRFSEDFKLAGRRYRAWTGVWKPGVGPVLHLAPLEGFLGRRVVGSQETVLDFGELLGRWTKDIEKRGHYLGEVQGTRLVSYFEHLPRRRLRVSVWEIRRDADGMDRLSGAPRDHLVLTGRWGQEVASRIVTAGPRHFRFRFMLDDGSVQVEELP